MYLQKKRKYTLSLSDEKRSCMWNIFITFKFVISIDVPVIDVRDIASSSYGIIAAERQRLGMRIKE